VILDTKGNTFGGFTPVEWESRVWNGKYDDENNCMEKGGCGTRSMMMRTIARRKAGVEWEV
jgi:hypothetical protein